MFGYDIHFILPEIALSLFALALLIGLSFWKRDLLPMLSFVGVAAAAVLMPGCGYGPVDLFHGLIVHDGISLFFRWLVLLVSGLTILMSLGYRDIQEEDRGEYYFFLLVITAAMMFAVSANNLMMIYLTLESVSILSYILVGYLKRDKFSAEAGLKYFLFGALGTGISLYGISLVYGLLGTLSLPAIAQHVHLAAENLPMLLIALIFILAGFAFKCSLVPFHMWTPDVYQGAPTPVAGFLSVGTKAVGFAFIVRVFVECFHPLWFVWTPLAMGMGVATMTIGNCMALGQTNIKRLLAYSTIAQAGYILVALAVPGGQGLPAGFFYIFTYVLMNLAAFGSVIVASQALHSEHMDDYTGLFRRNLLTAVFLAVALLSLAGLPPLAGFMAKFLVLAALIKAKFVGIAVIMAVNSVIAMFYYLKVVRTMFVQEPQKKSADCAPSPALALGLTLAVAGNVILGLCPQPVMDWLTTIIF